jgi:hypothetical protein
MLGPRPSAAVSSRVLAALEEGIADYYAATILGSPELGARSLAAPPRITGDDWAAIAQPAFDPHRLGWKLAGSLWARRVDLEDLVDCMAHGVDDASGSRVSDAIAAWLDACPVRSRDAIRAHVCSWVPRELAPTCSP